jgi:site-specific DNA-methyltransferase (adenine-specific)
MSLNDGMFSSACPTWETPDDLFAALNVEFRFNLDAAATIENAKLQPYLSPPPHITALYISESHARSEAERLKVSDCVAAKMWFDNARKIHRELLHAQQDYLAAVQWDSRTWLNPPYGDELPLWLEACVAQARNGCTVVALVPARIDTAWWVCFANEAHERREIRGRLKFKGAPTCAPFPSAVLVFRPPPPRSLAAGSARWARRLCVMDTKGVVERVIFGDPMETA